MDQIDYLKSEFIISESLVQKLDTIQGVHKVDPRLILENSVREIPGIIPDPVEGIKAVIIGNNRVEDALILGVEPENVVNEWLIFGRTLEEDDQMSTMIGDSLAVNIFDNAFNQSIKVFDESSPPFFDSWSLRRPSQQWKCCVHAPRNFTHRHRTTRI